LGTLKLQHNQSVTGLKMAHQHKQKTVQ